MIHMGDIIIHVRGYHEYIGDVQCIGGYHDSYGDIIIHVRGT